MLVKPNQVVTINFTLKNSEGEILESTKDHTPLAFISGHNQILPKIEETAGEMLIGSKKNIVLAPPDAYGEYDESAVQMLDKKEFPDDIKLEEGMNFVANAPDGSKVPFVIKSIETETITVDFNHPLAGETLNFDLELVDVRDATAEELAHGHVHGPGGHHH